MHYSEIIATLTPEQKAKIAARLTAAVMNNSLPEQQSPNTPMRTIDRKCELTEMVFARILNFLGSGEEPGKFPKFD